MSMHTLMPVCIYTWKPPDVESTTARRPAAFCRCKFACLRDAVDGTMYKVELAVVADNSGSGSIET